MTDAQRQRGVKSLYYAHPMNMYGTQAEKDDLIFLQKEFPNARIVNPADMKEELGERRGSEAMAFFLGKLVNLDGLAYRRFPDGMLSAGVAREVLEAWLFEKEVWRIVGGHKLYAQPGYQPRTLHHMWRYEESILSISQTREYLREEYKL